MKLRRSGLRVFAVEDRSVQITWRSLEGGELRLELGGRSMERQVAPGPGSLTLEGLDPVTPYTLQASGAGLPSHGTRLAFRTLASPPGPELFRLATVSDLHVGATAFDTFGRMVERIADGAEPHPIRCGRAAVQEAVAWGAQRLIVKGDITERGLPKEWDDAGKVFGDLPIPVNAICGNHDTKKAPGKLVPAEGAARAALPLAEEVTAIDVPGLRIVLVPTVSWGSNSGRISDPIREKVVALLREATEGALIVLHHQLQRLPVNWFWPPGVPGPQATRFLRAVAEANPRSVLTSGHTHRHRKRTFGPLVITEVGSPKDYPGTWGGYVVHEGGIRQVVRRVEAPECVEWLERTRHAALGVWGIWSPGTLHARCFTRSWGERAPSATPS